MLVLKSCRLYNTFGSGAIHGVYAQFTAQSAIFNKGKKIGLLRGASTRFATWFYAMMRILRLKDALLSTVHQASFKELAKTDVTRAAVLDITNLSSSRHYMSCSVLCFPLSVHCAIVTRVSRAWTR